MKIINSNYDEQTGISTVTIGTKYGQFTGKARLHPNDITIASKIAGCRYAEFRATIKYLKAEQKDLKQQLKTFIDFYLNICQHSRFNEKEYTNIQIRKRIDKLQRDIEINKAIIKNIEMVMKHDIEQREQLKSYIKNKNKTGKNE